MKNSVIWTLLLLAICSVSLQAQPYWNSESILLENVKALTFSKGQMTTGRRSSPISQLQCVGGSATSYYDQYPSTVQCVNVGSDGFGNIQWKCEADLDSSVRFGQTTVSCEGFNHPDDPYILKGSCGLEYTLNLTEQGRQSKGYSGGHQNHYQHNSQPYYVDNSQKNFNWGNVLMFVILGVIIMGLLKQCNQNAGGTNPSSSSYGPGFNPGNNPGGSYPGNYPPGCAPNTYGTTYGAPYQPGFWSGLGTGGLLGYLMRPRPAHNYYNTGYSAPSYRSGWGSTTSFGSSPSPSTSSPRTASAFANTRRR